MSLVFIGIWLPLTLAFYLTEEGPEFMSAIESAMDCLFLLDIIVTFSTAVLKDDQLVTSRSEIAKIYLQKWFWIDLVATIPIDTFVDISHSEELHDAEDNLPHLNYYRAFRLFRFLRFLKLFKKTNQMKKYANKIKCRHGLDRLMRMILVFIFMTHWVACFWIL